MDTKQRNKADKLWFRKYLQPKCEICGGKAIQLHHYFYKRNYPHLRYDKENGISLCKGCHFVLHYQDSHRIEDKIIAKRGKKWLTALKKKAYNPPKFFKFNDAFILKATNQLKEI